MGNKQVISAYHDHLCTDRPEGCGEAMKEFHRSCDGCRNNYTDDHCMLGKIFQDEKSKSCIEYYADLEAYAHKQKIEAEEKQ